MKKVIDELKSSSVLSKEEIERIKLYVKKKYPDNSDKENAIILSSTIYEIIDNNLEGINSEDNQHIKKNIIKNTILKGKKNILKWDVFSELTTELKEKPQYKENIIRWVNKNQKNNISVDTFDNYLISKENLRSVGKSLTLDIEKKLNSGIVKNIKIEYKDAQYNVVSSVNSRYKNIFSAIKNAIAAKFINFSRKISSSLEYFLKMVSSRKIIFSILALLVLSLYSLNYLDINIDSIKAKFKIKTVIDKNHIPIIDSSELHVIDEMSYHPDLPDFLNYKDIDKDKLLEFLNMNNSMLVQEPYFSSIIKSSKEFNLNPNLLFAITGQEQSFVPRDHKDAQKIANNPFNVFHSWQDYNTDINDSSKIAARTVINLAKGKPLDIDIFDWINNKYAGDKNWGKGVKAIFEKLEQ